MTLTDRHFGTSFFNWAAAATRDVQHTWFFGHLEVYIRIRRRSGSPAR
jgi:cytochrome c oxidase subunit 1